MNVLTDVLYWLSTALMIPVIVMLLTGFVWALFRGGLFCRIWSDRGKLCQRQRQLTADIEAAGVSDSLSFGGQASPHHLFSATFNRLQTANWNRVQADKILVDFELAQETALDGARILMRMGPMLGLMGTLIPMGPALVGLASGDIAAMALNMQVAFSTTVIGIVIGAIGFVIQLVSRRWLMEDLNTLHYVVQIMDEKGAG